MIHRFREAVLRNTLAMLQQKRSAFLRGIIITYVDTTPRLPCVINDQSAQASLQQAKNEAETARLEATQYSGGLVKVMALVRQATGMTTVAAIEQQMAFMKLGISLPPPHLPEARHPSLLGYRAATRMPCDVAPWPTVSRAGRCLCAADVTARLGGCHDLRAPFGLTWGVASDEVRKTGVDLTADPSAKDFGVSFMATNLGKVLSDTEGVLLSFGFNDKLGASRPSAAPLARTRQEAR